MAITIKNIFIALAMTLFINASFAQSIDQKPNNSTVRGDGEATQKDFTFNTGLGVNNPKLFTSDGAQLGAFTQNFVMGRGSAEDITLTVDQGLGSANPFLRWDSMISQWTFSNDGINSLPLGSGNGGGGINSNNAFGSSDNANGESGIAAWSYSGGGVFASLTTDPLEGSSTFTITGGLTSEFIQGPFLNMNRSIFRGRACEASIEYIGGVEGLNYRILDMSGNVVAERELPVHTISAPESVFFFCPSVSQIGTNPDLAQLRVSIESPSTGNLSFFAFDRSYLGTFRNLAETIPPSDLSARVQVFQSIPRVSDVKNDFPISIDPVSAGGGIIQEGNIVSSVTGSASLRTINWQVGLFNLPPIVVPTCVGENRGIGGGSTDVLSLTNTQMVYRCLTSNGAAVLDDRLNLKVSRHPDEAILPVVQPIVVGQVTTNSSENLVVRHCTFTNGVGVGANAPLTMFSNCDSWINSLTLENANRRVDLSLVDGVFPNSETMTCHVDRTLEALNFTGNSGADPLIIFQSNSLIQFSFFGTNGVPFSDSGFITCLGSL